MPLNNSGVISIGGPTVGESINLELGRAATATSNLNETDLRNLAEIPNGQISLSNFYGKSSVGWYQINITATLTRVIWAGNLFVVIGQTGTVVTSPDAVTWTKQKETVFENLSLQDIAYNNGKYIIVGNNGGIWTSTTATTWTKVTSGTTQNLFGITSGNGTEWRAVGSSGTILKSTDDGATWTAETSPTAVDLYSISHTKNGNNTYMAVGATRVIIRWRGYTASPVWEYADRTHENASYNFFRVVWDSSTNYFYIAGIRIYRAYIDTSADNFIGTGGSYLEGSYPFAVFKRISSGKYIGIGPGITAFWNQVSSTISTSHISQNAFIREVNGPTDFAFSSNKVVFVGAKGLVWINSLSIFDSLSTSNPYFTSARSDTGITRYTISRGNNWRQIAYNGSEYAITGFGGTVTTSTNGRDWTKGAWSDSTGNELAQFTGISGGMFILWAFDKWWTIPVGNYIYRKNTVNQILESDYFLPAATSPFVIQSSVAGSSFIPYIAKVLNGILIFGGQSQLMYTADGTNWSVPTVPNLTQSSQGNFHGLIWTGQRYILHGMSIWSSTNLGTWTRLVDAAGLIPASSSSIANISATNNAGQVVVAGKNTAGFVGSSAGFFIRSTDYGATWGTRQNHAYAFREIVYNGTLYVAIFEGPTNTNQRGLIGSSTDAQTWTYRYAGTNYFNKLSWNGSRFIAVGDSGAVVTSTTGTSWTVETVPTTETLNNVYDSATRTLIVGNNGVIITYPSASSNKLQ